MGKRFQLSMVIAAIVLVSMITVRASGQTATVPDLDARDAREQRSPSPAEALAARPTSSTSSPLALPYRQAR